MPNRSNKKRKKTIKSNNPLSQARGKLSAEELWARKTGVGYECFVEYYSQQPIGTVSSSSSSPVNESPLISQEPVTTGAAAAAAAAATTTSLVGKGLSRAAKRRKKKKGVVGIGGVVDNNELLQEQEDGRLIKASNRVENNSKSHPLLQAVEKQSSKINSSQLLRKDLHPFFQVMAKPLPLTFRIRQTANLDKVEQLVSNLQSLNLLRPNCIRPVFELLNEGGNKKNSNKMQVYQASLSKGALTHEHPVIRELLLKYSQNGVMARQELGSMLPVVALVRAGAFLQSSSSSRRCLDLCASPGSKTLQALEVMMSSSSKTKPLLVANDILKSRLETLQQAVERSGMEESQTRHIVYTCQDATKFELRAAAATGKSDSSSSRPPLLQFDVVLCDVVCSGDGTCRKDKLILPQWKPAIGQQLHSTQVAILSRAVELLKDEGGVVCYSTCSLNPIENEAVVATVLQKFNKNDAPTDQEPTLELVEWPNVPGVVLHDGISSWKVADFNIDRESDGPAGAKNDNDCEDSTSEASDRIDTRLVWYNSCEETKERSAGKLWSPSMWPPYDAAKLRLSRCKRLLPQDQDSGGFFLALLRKNRSKKNTNGS